LGRVHSASTRLGGDVFEAAGDRFEPFRVEREPVDQRAADPGALCLGDIVGVGSEDLVRPRAHGGGRGPERIYLRLRRG
jgi:hypothetical protein